MSGSKLLKDADAADRADPADPATWPSNWRDNWEFQESSTPLPQAWHRSGLCFFFEFEKVDEDGNWTWVVMDDDISQSRLEELRIELADEAFFRMCTQLGREAKVRWLELGHKDWTFRSDLS